MASKLLSYFIPSFQDGYNSYTQSRASVKKTEIPFGYNTVLDNNGAATKRAGRFAYGSEIYPGHFPTGGAQFKTDTKNELIIACGDKWWKKVDNIWVSISGKTFASDKDTFFVQAMDRLYGCNGVDNLCYYDGNQIIELSSNGGVFDKVEYAYNRLWGIKNGKVYYSNPINDDGTLGNFGTFDTDLNSDPVKNAGYLEPKKGSGTHLVDLKEDGGALWIIDNRRIRKVGSPTDNTDKSVNFPVTIVSSEIGGISSKGSVKDINDFWFYSGENIYTNGEVAQYTNPQTRAKSGRIKSEINSVATTGMSKVALGYYSEKLYFAYQNGAYNDRVEVLDTRLNAWSTPFTGWNVHSFLNFTEEDGTHRFLGLSSNDSYVYELETGLDDNGNPIGAAFECLSTDCDKPGLTKRFGFIRVFFSSVFGSVDWELYIDEKIKDSGTYQFGASNNRSVGIGSQLIGTYLIGNEYPDDAIATTLAQDDFFEIDCGYEDGKRVSVRFLNNKTGEQYNISGLGIFYKPGNIQE